MKTNIDVLKELIKNTVKETVDNEKRFNDFEEASKKVSLEDYLTFVDIMEAHYLANNIMEEYQKDMKSLISAIVYNSWLLPDKTIGEIMAITVEALKIQFKGQENIAIQEELIEKFNGKEFLENYRKEKKKQKALRKEFNLKY